MSESEIVIRGAREHNLRNVHLELPRNQLIAMTGVSGSGKSSLAFDTLYAEGQRRYVESLSSYARQFLGQLPKPEVDSITGLSPSISIQQKTSGRNPRSTVGTITEIYDYLRVLFARVGQGFCPRCDRPITAQSREQILESVRLLPAGTKFLVLAPVVQRQKGEYRDLFEDLLKQGFLRARVDGRIVSLTENLQLDRQMRHTIDVVIDRLTAGSASGRTRLAEAIEAALRLGSGSLIIAQESPVAGASAVPRPTSALPRKTRKKSAEKKSAPPPESAAEENAELSSPASDQPLFADRLYSAHYACTHCGSSYEPPSPQLFSFNSPQGMCTECHGLAQCHTFDLQALIPNPRLSIRRGAIALIGTFKELGRWRRHLFAGIANTLEKDLGLEPDSLLDTPWSEIPAEAQRQLLHGTGTRNITFRWKHRGGVWVHGGTWEGVVPELLEKFRKARNPMLRRQLEKHMRVLPCTSCRGTRLNPQARAVRLRTAHPEFVGKNGAPPAALGLPDVCALTIAQAADFFTELELDGTARLIAEEVLKEIRGRLGFLLRCGLNYLTLDRTAPTLSGGESQRIRLAGQIGCGLVGVVYILDEPSIGLHPRDNEMLLGSLLELRDLGNTVIVVEHDEETIRAADFIVDFGPGPGVRGGEVVAQGTLADLAQAARSVTGQYLSGKRQIAIPGQRRSPGEKQLVIRGARQNNLKHVDIPVPLETFVCVTGVSGSGKSSLVNDILWEALHRDLNEGEGEPGAHDGISGLEHLDKAINIDQSPIGRTPRSNPATYVKLFDLIRDLYTHLPESKLRGYKAGRFSFNVPGGRCEACEGHGSTRLEMDFLADVWVTCPVCQGKRFNHETLEVHFKGASIADVLDMDVQQALEHFSNQPKILKLLQTLHDVGLDYLKLGQPSPTLSGGEAQRIKLARELAKRATGRTLYLLDEPTTGLHFADIHKLLEVLHGFVDAGNSVIVVEHNLDVIKTADWVIDLGPEGGAGGGAIVVAGTPETVARCQASHTGRALQPVLNPAQRRAAPLRGSQAPPGRLPVTARSVARQTSGGKTSARPSTRSKTETPAGPPPLCVQGAEQHNLQHVDLEIPRYSLSVFCGPSGSGKSSLAMDTLYAEGQRRYVESLSSYARQFLGQMPKPKVEHVSGLSPAIAIEQKTVGHTPRSTVGTVTEIYDYLRILFARLGQPFCPRCDIPVQTQAADEVIEKVLALPAGRRVLITAPQEVHVGDSYERLWTKLREQGYRRVRVDGATYALEEVPELDRRRRHEVQIIIDRVTIDRERRSRIAESIEKALDLGLGWMHVVHVQDELAEPDWHVDAHSLHKACQQCGESLEDLSPNNFSFNSVLGWCPACEGLGVQQGTNLESLVADPKRTLADGAVAGWPRGGHGLFPQMLQALSKQTGVPLDVRFERLEPRHQRIVLYGAGEKWISVEEAGFKFQYKGLYPAVEEATRISPAYRQHLDHLIGEVPCSVCQGSRLRSDAAAVRFQGQTLQQLTELSLGECLEFARRIKLKPADRKIAGELLREVTGRLSFLVDVGLHYLTLARTMPTLSGGESQRIRLAGQVGRALTGVLYVLDEPTIGLHPRDNARLLGVLRQLRDLGNTVILVEHDREVLEAADRLYDFGPGAGRFGGTIVGQGTPRDVARQTASLTGKYLSGAAAIPVPHERRMAPLVSPAATAPVAVPARRTRGKTENAGRRTATTPQAPSDGKTILGDPAATPGKGWLELIGARHHNLRDVDLRIPLGTLTCMTGVSGSGKSSLLEETLARAVARHLHRASEVPGAYDELRGLNFLNKVIQVDQQPLGSTPASNPATYTGVFDQIRELFARLPEAKVRGYRPGRFSFNRAGGRCEVCEGNGQKCIEMHFLPDVWVECDACRGRRFNEETLAVKFKGHSISDVLHMSIGQAHELFSNVPAIRGILATLCAVGLDYLTLGQSAATLSGGEAQRVKLAAELARPQTGRTLYLLDEPTTGLHFDDIRKLLKVLHSLVEQGNTVVVIEHNLDVIKTADWVIDLGPEAGAAGGWIVAQGTPEDVVTQAAALRTRRTPEKAFPPAISAAGSAAVPPPFRSYTGELLAPVLAAGPRGAREIFDAAQAAQRQAGDLDARKLARDVKMPWQSNGRQWHTVDRVSHTGKPCQWEGAALALVTDFLAMQSGFEPVNWTERSVVEVKGAGEAAGWFFHALTGDEWILTLKFRVPKKTFEEAPLAAALALQSFDDIDEIPVYGRADRVRVQNLKGPWQEVLITVHWLRDLQTPPFRQFLQKACAAYLKFIGQNPLPLQELTPWKVLGRKWHLSRKGFPKEQPVAWPEILIRELAPQLEQIFRTYTGDWTKQHVVTYTHPGMQRVKVELYTKRCEGLDLLVNVPAGKFQEAGIAALGAEREILSAGDGREIVKFRLTELGQIRSSPWIRCLLACAVSE